QRGQAGIHGDPGLRELTHRQQAGVAPDALRPGRDLLPGDPAQRVDVVAHLERAETLVTGVLRGERVLRAAGAADQVGGWGGDGRRVDSRRHGGLPLIFPGLSRTELAPAARSLVVESITVVAGASSGRSLCPSG